MRLQKFIMVSVVLIACPTNCPQAATAAIASMEDHPVGLVVEEGLRDSCRSAQLTKGVFIRLVLLVEKRRVDERLGGFI